MKKFITILVFLLFALQANVFAQNEILITGKKSGMSIDDAWISVDVSKSLVSIFSNFFRNIVSENNVSNYDRYFLSISDVTNIVDRKGKSVEMENLTIGDKIVAKGIMLYEENGVRFMEATEIVVEKQRTFLQAVMQAIVDRREQDVEKFSKTNNVVTIGEQNNSQTGSSESQDGCVGEGEPLLSSPLFMVNSDSDKKCCDGLVLCNPGENKIINKGGLNYIVEGICRKHCEVTTSPGFNLEINKDTSFGLNVSQNLPMIPVIAPQCRSDLDCQRLSQTVTIGKDPAVIGVMPNTKSVCRSGFCVTEITNPWSPSADRDQKIAEIQTIPGSCLYDSDCELDFDGRKCIAADPVTKGFLESLKAIFFGNKKECVCIQNKCQKIGGPNDLPGLPHMDCGDEIMEVCGADGKTYRNPCEAIKAGTDVKGSGKCEEDISKDKDNAIGLPESPFPIDDPMVCDGNSECLWCNVGCFTKKMITDSNMTCDANKKMPSDMTCVCDSRTKMCKTFPKQGVQPITPTTTNPSRANIPDNICITNRDCGFCGSQCLTNSILQKMSSSGNNCNISLKPENSVCICRAGNCVVEYTKPPTSPTPPSNEVTYPGVPSTPTPGQNVNPPLTNAKPANIPGFCGTQTEGYCASDSDCMVGGCSGTVCQAKSEGSMPTICEWLECYTKPARTYCGCVRNKCSWYQPSSTLNTTTTTTTIPNIPIPPMPPISAPSLPGDGNGISLPPAGSDQICLFVMTCLNGRILNADCGEVGNKCYQFHDLGNDNCACY